MNATIVGIDVGGANLKAALWQSDRAARALARPLAMWKEHRQLAQATGQLLGELLNSTSTPCHLAVTLTGELADCFASRREGVAYILGQLCQVVPEQCVHVYTVDGQWLTTQQAVSDPWRVAASNWHALANWLCQWPQTAPLCHHALLVDIGSTTIDIIPLIKGSVATAALTDRERLQSRQLIYSGMQRTPVCALVSSLKLRDCSVPVMAELFATVDDAWLVLEEIPPQPADCQTADGRPRTAACAAARLARMIGEDSERLAPDELRDLARQVIASQVRQIVEALFCNLARVRYGDNEESIIFSGHGLPLWQQVIRKMEPARQVHLLTDLVGDEVSRCAPAAAVGWLLGKRSL